MSTAVSPGLQEMPLVHSRFRKSKPTQVVTCPSKDWRDSAEDPDVRAVVLVLVLRAVDYGRPLLPINEDADVNNPFSRSRIDIAAHRYYARTETLMPMHLPPSHVGVGVHGKYRSTKKRRNGSIVKSC